MKEEKIEESIKYKELIDTVIEGLSYINNQLNIGELNNTINILNDMIIGINTVICGISDMLDKNQYAIIKQNIEVYLNSIVSSYESKDIINVMFIINEKLAPTLVKIKTLC